MPSAFPPTCQKERWCYPRRLCKLQKIKRQLWQQVKSPSYSSTYSSFHTYFCHLPHTTCFTLLSREFAVNEVVAGVREYFNVMLGTQLLYKFERPQYADVLANHPDTSMSQIYGAPHLLRLFGKYPTAWHTTPLRFKTFSLSHCQIQYLLWKIEETDTGGDESKYKHTNGNPNSETNLDLFYSLFMREPGLTVCVDPNITADCWCNKINNRHNCQKFFSTQN